MAAAPSPFAPSKETTNYARLCLLLVDLGSKALRDTFDKVHPPSTLHRRLLSHKPTLQPLYTGFGKKKVKKVLNPTQWGKLYPVHSPVTSASFDVTLLTVLLRNICGFSPPATGWDNLPPPTDTSTAGDIARVKYYRNTVYGHANQASVDDASFNAYWHEIREALVRLGGTSFRGYIDNLEHDSMDPDMEEHYRELMKQWKKDDDSIKEKLEEMEENISDKLQQMNSEMKNNIQSEMKEIKERLDTLTALLEENKDEVSSENIRLQQMSCEMEKNIRSEMKEIKKRLDTLTASLEEIKDEERCRDDLNKMRSEISDKLDALTVSLRETQDEENRDKFEQMKDEMVKLGERLENSLENVRLQRGESDEKEIIRDKLEQMKSKMENNIGGVMREMKERLDTLTASYEENKDQENLKDKFEQMRYEMVNLGKRLENLLENLRIQSGQGEEKDPFDPSELIDGIRQLYKTREGWLTPFPWCEEFHFQLDDIYTRLKVIGKKKTRGIATDEIVNMSAIFKPHEECPQPRTVLIEGKPAMGKTTYCKKLVYDWATGKLAADDCFPKLETVLLLKCRDIKSNIWEAIDDQLLPRDIQEDIREKFFTFIRHNQSSVLLVLDGLDELPPSKLPEFSEIIQGRVLPKCHLVTTSRYEAGMKVRRYCDTILEIEGFTEEDARKFIRKYFKNMKDLAQKLLIKLRNDKSLQDMTANPLNTALLCLLCEECRGIFPESSTQLYLDIIDCVLRRFRRKKGLPETSEKLTELYKTELKLLGRIALNGLHQGNLDFDEHELRNHNVELSGFGFLSVQLGGSKMKPCRHYAFLHKSFQEIFAAYYLCCELLKQEITAESLVSHVRYFNELKQVLLFSCGILAVQCEETAVDLMRNITTQVNSFGAKTVPIALECIAECKREQSNFHVKLARVFGSGLKLQTVEVKETTLEKVHFASLAEAMKVNTTLAKLNLSINRNGVASAVSLAEAVKVNTTMTQLSLSNSYIGDAGAASLAEAMKGNKTLTKLSLCYGNISVAGAASLAEAMKVNRTLTELRLDGNHIGDAGAASLAETMKVNKTQTKLALWKNNIGAAGAASLAEAIEVNTTLTQLHLRNNNIGDAGAASLAEAMKVNKTLTELFLWDNKIGDAGTASLAEAMKVNKTLTKLLLWDSKIDAAASASTLAEAMKVNTTLTNLSLSCNEISAAGAASLAEAMNVNTTLTQMRISGNNIGAGGAASLAEAIKVNTTLTKLHLDGNNIKNARAASLAEAMKVNKTLAELHLQDNDIGDAGAAFLAEAMKINTTLTELHLERNNIGAAGAASLAEAMKVNTTLTQLHLDRNNIRAAGAASLAEAMKVNTTLTQLHLDCNNIGAGGAASLGEAMKVNTTLTELHPGSNNIGDAGVASLAEGMKVNTTLTWLHLWADEIGTAGATSLAEAIKVNTTLTRLHLKINDIGDAGAACFAEAMKVNTTLTELVLWYNNIGNAGAASFSEAMKINTTLAKLDLSRNNIDVAGAASLAEAMKVNTTLIVHY